MVRHGRKKGMRGGEERLGGCESIGGGIVGWKVLCRVIVAGWEGIICRRVVDVGTSLGRVRP